MAGEAGELIEQEEELDEGQEEGQTEEIGAEQEGEESEGETEESGQEDADEVTVTIGEEPSPEEEEERRAPEWVRDLRKSNREKDRAIRERDAEIARLKGASQQSTVVLGPKPTLESSDYDAEKFEQDLEAWHARKVQIDAEAANHKQAEAAAQAAWQTKLESYGKAKAALKVKDYEDAEGLVQDMLNVTQQGIILQGAENPATMVYALGKNPKKAKELASITDPVKFAFAIAKLETQLKVTPRKSAPVPERTVRSSVAGAAAVDNQLAKLQAEADKTGDRSKVAAYLRQKKARG